MTQEQIIELVENGHFPNSHSKASLLETHISWVILTEQFAYKIKKPVKFNFLDFSTLALRKFYCEEELKLNRRLTDIYLALIPIVKSGNRYGVEMAGETIDYAVQMNRLPANRQMHELLEKGEVNERDVEVLAQMIADFHQRATVVKKPFDATAAASDFADLRSAASLIAQYVDESYAQQIKEWIALAGKIIDTYSYRFYERVEEGFVRDVHGDLHSGNIFLLEKPVIFDCIEFNEHFRINDVLSELAFLAMDLERWGRLDLKNILIQTYRKHFPCFTMPEDEILFLYFLFYRSTIRLKVTALRIGERTSGKSEAAVKNELRDLAKLCGRYAADLALKT